MTPRRNYPARWVVVAVSLVTLLAFVGGLAARSLGENERIDSRVNANNVKIERDIQADCPFKRTIAELPGRMLDVGRTPPEFILVPARAARVAYIRKHCAEALDPDTDRPFGPAPEVRDR